MRDRDIQIVCSELNKFKDKSLELLPNFTTFRLELESYHKIYHGELLDILKHLHSQGDYIEVIEHFGISSK